MKPEYSFSVGIGMDPASLGSFLSSYFNGNRIVSYLSRIYMENPFRLLLDSDSERKTKESAFSIIARVITDSGAEPVFVFDYTCMGDHHLTANFQAKLGRLLGFLDSIGVKSISLSDLYLAETFSSDHPPYNRFKHFKVYVSPRAKFNHVIKLKYIENINYAAITLHPDLNRNFEEIQRALSFAGKDRIEIVVNSGCFTSCPLEIFCNALRFHMNEEETEEEEERPATYYTDKCRSWLENDPSWTYQLPLILPERIDDYLKVGVEYFRILNNPDSLEDAKTKLMHWLDSKNPDDPAVLIYGREEILEGRWETDKAWMKEKMKAANKTADAFARFIEG
jgi:hypothetical protein